MRRALRTATTALLAAGVLAGAPACGTVDELEQDAAEVREQVRTGVEERADRVRTELRRRREELRRRIEEVLGRLEQVLPRATETSPRVQARGRTGTTTIDAFLTDVLGSVDAYWTKTLARSGLPEPRVAYEWISPRRRSLTRCGEVADDMSAFYCPADDTIYIGQRFAAELYEGVLQGLPGEGRAAGDFGVAYVVAHEYAHNLQQELGLFSFRSGRSSKPFELQADCLAGAWGSSVLAEGRLQPGDIEEAVGTALAVGDFDVSDVNHHGTPAERRDAWLDGFESADPSRCRRYVPEV